MGLSKILVTGGAGFIGSHLVDRLLTDGCRVVALDDLSSGKMQNLERHSNGPNFRFVKGDIRDKKTVDSVMSDVDAVVHEAAFTSVPLSIKNPKLTNDVNIAGTLNLLMSSLRKNIGCFIFASSAAVYGAATKMPIAENSQTRPLSPYGESKLGAEKKCQEFWKTHGLKTVCLRYFNVYGPRQTGGEYAGVISRIFDRLHNNLPPVIYGDGKQTRDFIYIDDAVDATILTLNSNAAGETINVGTGGATSVIQVCQTLQEIMDKTAFKPIHEAPRVGDIRHSQADITKSKKILGYSPKVSLKEGLEKFVAWRSGR